MTSESEAPKSEDDMEEEAGNREQDVRTTFRFHRYLLKIKDVLFPIVWTHKHRKKGGWGLPP